MRGKLKNNRFFDSMFAYTQATNFVSILKDKFKEIKAQHKDCDAHETAEYCPVCDAEFYFELLQQKVKDLSLCDKLPKEIRQNYDLDDFIKRIK